MGKLNGKKTHGSTGNLQAFHVLVLAYFSQIFWQLIQILLLKARTSRYITHLYDPKKSAIKFQFLPELKNLHEV